MNSADVIFYLITLLLEEKEDSVERLEEALSYSLEKITEEDRKALFEIAD